MKTRFSESSGTFARNLTDYFDDLERSRSWNLVAVARAEAENCVKIEGGQLEVTDKVSDNQPGQDKHETRIKHSTECQQTRTLKGTRGEIKRSDIDRQGGTMAA